MTKTSVDEFIETYESIEADKRSEFDQAEEINQRIRADTQKLEYLFPVIKSVCDGVKQFNPSLAADLKSLIKDLVIMVGGKHDDLVKMSEWYARRTLKLELLGEVMPGALRSMRAFENADRRKAKDPKVAAMADIKVEFSLWQDGNAHYKSRPDFARKMCLKHPVLSNVTSIQNACTKWHRERKSSG